MSFRSRSRSTAPPIVPRRRSVSQSREPYTSTSNTSLSSYYNNNTPSYTSRPLSTGYYPGSQTNTTSLYQSPYNNHYGSRENLYNHHSTRNGFYPNGNTRRDTYTGSTYSFSKNLGSYDKRFGGSVYGSDRYISPYSKYDNGITTAGLSLGGGGLSGKTYSQKNSSSYTPSNNTSNSNKKRDYTPVRNSTNLITSKPHSTSNTSLNTYSLNKPTKVSVGTDTPAAIVARSSSLREQERKGRSRTRSRAANARSTSASSEKSEGYESGSERTSRSRLGSTSSLSGSTETKDGKKSAAADTSSANGEVLDYKALWEAAKLENDKLKTQLKKRDEELSTAKTAVEKFTNATTKNSLSELEKRERRAMERKLSEMEEELKQLETFKTENQRLKEENGALIRVISKLSK